MPLRAFRQVDVFAATAYRGNALAVVLDGTSLSQEQMQHFARWTNLSETTFVLPPETDAADYRIRIFTPGGELPFAGHPTLGSCHAWLEAGGRPRSEQFIVQECQAGLVRIRREGSQLAFAAPTLKRSAPSPVVLAQVAGALGVNSAQVVAAQTLDNGPVWLSLLMDSPETVLRLSPNHSELKKIGVKVGVAAIYGGASQGNSASQASHSGRAVGDGPRLEVRAFAAPMGITEDPVTGSLNASLAQWLIADGHLPAQYLAAQGACMDREGRVHIQQDASGQVWVGGDSITCISGSVSL